MSEQTDKQLVNSFWAIFNDCCDRYGVSSFDWPTLGMIFPVERARLSEIKEEGRKRIKATGVFNGQAHDRVTCKPVAE